MKNRGEAALTGKLNFPLNTPHRFFIFYSSQREILRRARAAFSIPQDKYEFLGGSVPVDEIPFHPPRVKYRVPLHELKPPSEWEGDADEEDSIKFCHSHTKTDSCPVTIPYPSITIPAHFTTKNPQPLRHQTRDSLSDSTSLWFTHLDSR